MSTTDRSGLFRQGDVLLIRVDRVPDGGAVRQEGSRLVLAEGEATGHAHVLVAEGAELVQTRDGALYLTIGGTADLVHEEHDTIPLAGGVYEVRGQREYVPASFRRVAD